MLFALYLNKYNLIFSLFILEISIKTSFLYNNSLLWHFSFIHKSMLKYSLIAVIQINRLDEWLVNCTLYLELVKTRKSNERNCWDFLREPNLARILGCKIASTLRNVHILTIPVTFYFHICEVVIEHVKTIFHTLYALLLQFYLLLIFFTVQVSSTTRPQ